LEFTREERALTNSEISSDSSINGGKEGYLV
jgi:hypothetical protein